MKYIVVVAGASSSILYVQEAKVRGFGTIVANPPQMDEILAGPFREMVGDSVITIDFDDKDVDSLVKKLEKYEIVGIFAGSDGGVTVTDILCEKMGFPGNNPKTTFKRITKDGMQNALKDAGLRYIKSTVVKSEKDVETFWKKNKLSKGFMKYSFNTSSFGNKAVFSVDEAINHFRVLKNSHNAFGESSDIILQEYIEGTEYIVDSVSCDGKHMITDIWKYSKVMTSSGDIIYDCGRLMMSIEPGIYDLIRYAYKVLDATEFKYGPCHGEYKIDENGPILMETNARPIGTSMNVPFLHEVLGHHVSDICMDAVFNPEQFELRRKKLYRPKKSACIKNFIVQKEADANLILLKTILYNLKSFRQVIPEINDEIVHLQKTTDLDSSPLMIKMCHEDSSVVEEECDFLRMLEEKYFELIFSNAKKTKPVKINTDVFSLVKFTPRTARILIVTNEGKFVSQFDKIEKANSEWDYYNGLIYAVTEESSISDRFISIAKELTQVRSGGFVAVAPEVYQALPRGSVSVEVIFKMLNCTVELPLMESKGVIFGFKN